MKKMMWLLTGLVVTALTAGCAKAAKPGAPEERNKTSMTVVTPETKMKELEEDFFAATYDGDYGFQDFLDQGGASTDSEVVAFLAGRMQLGENRPIFQTDGFGCSTLTVRNSEDEIMFGRNFDWQNCEALVLRANPTDAYASIATVNMDFIYSGYGSELSRLPDEIRTMIALYAPLDGMNESGLAVSVNMIQDSERIDQDTGKPDLTTTTAIRLLLDQAASVEEAVELLKQYDMHSSMGMMVHFALADKTGHSVVIEYVNQEMVVTETPAVTNFYLAEGEKYGIGSAQSHTRYEILMEQLSEQEVMEEQQVKEALNRVSKDNFGEFESTEWSIVFNLNRGEACYYHREDYENGYRFRLKED